MNLSNKKVETLYEHHKSNFSRPARPFMRFYTKSHRCMAFAKVASSIKGLALLFILHSTTNSKTFNKMALAIVLSLSLVLVHYASGHARLLQPPSRSSMWRLGFDNPADYSDNQGFCGGIKVSSNYPILTNFAVKSQKANCIQIKPNI